MNRQMRFTSKALNALPPCDPDSRAREYELSDLEVSGLRLIVNKKGRKSFLFRYSSPEGNKRSMGLGVYPDLSINDARQKALEARQQLAKGIDPQSDTAPTILTFRKFIEDAYLPHAKVANRSYKDVETRLRLHLLPRFGSLPLRDIRTQDIQRNHDRIRIERSPGTANRVLALLKRALNLAVLWGVLDKNPVKGVVMFKENQRQRYLAGDELKRFLKALEMEPNRTIADFFAFLLATGVRRNEALTAKWEDVHMGEARLWLPRTKSGHGRFVYLNEMGLAILKDRRRIEDNPYVFPSDVVKGGHFNDPAKPFRRLLRAAGISNFRPHDLRHTHASLAINAGASLYTVQHMLGHRNSLTTARYAHLSNDVLRATSNQVANLITESQKFELG